MGQQAAITLSSIVSQSPKILGTDLGEDVLIMQVETGKFTNLKDVGAEIWRMLEEPQTVAAIIDRLTGDFEVERGVCEAEVLAYLNDLSVDDLLTFSTDKT